MNKIAYSLFGNDPLYVTGALRNAEQVETVFPGWQAVFYVPSGYDPAIRKQLIDRGAIVRDGDPAIANGTFWRFLIADDPQVERFLIRDTDSRLIPRDARAVEAWIASGLPFHSLRDHPHHTFPLGGGLWGGMPGILPNQRDEILASGYANVPFERQTQYGNDQVYLARHVWPLVWDRCLQHDSCNRHLYPLSVPFPDGASLGDWRFTGEIVDANEVPNPIGWQMRINYMTNA